MHKVGFVFLCFSLPVILSWTSELVFSSSRKTLHRARISSTSAWPMTCGRTPSLLSVCMWGSCETRPSTTQVLSAWQVWSKTHTDTHTPQRWRISFTLIFDCRFFFVCAFKHQFSHKETNVDPPNFPFIYIYVCSYKQIRTLKNMHLITENKKQTRPDWISSGFGLKWGLKLVVEPLADVLLLLFLHQCNKQFWKSSSCDVRNVVISSPAVGWSFFFWALFLTLTPKCRSV